MSDIDNLIAAADEEQKIRKDQAAIRKQTSRSGYRGKVSKVPMIVSVLILVIAIIGLIIHFLPISEDAIRADLNATLDTAQASIEEYRREKGELPNRVPAPALSGMVQYETVGDGYRLSISMNGQTLRREQ